MSNESRIHGCLDGDLSRESLSLAEREALAALEGDLAVAVARLRVEPPRDLQASVMQCIPHAAPARSGWTRAGEALRAALDWLQTPRPVTLQLRPSYGLVAVVLLGLLPLAPARPGAPVDAPVATTGAAPVYVQFRLDAEQAASVSLAGSFSEWQPTIELRQSAPGVWTAMVPLTPGVHDYLFVVDGAEWVPDPIGDAVDDHFGGTNSRLYLNHPTTAL